jgi:hypothetical protein
MLKDRRWGKTVQMMCSEDKEVLWDYIFLLRDLPCIEDIFLALSKG